MQSELDGGKQELHLLIDRLSAEQVTAALRYIHYLCTDPVLLSLMNAPPDDEPYTEEERREDAEAMAALARGEGISHEEILSEFGLDPSEHT